MNSVFDKPVEVEVQELSEGIAIVIDGDTAPRAIASGQFLYIKNHSTLPTGGYNATAAIASGDTISSSNVIIDADGIANAIKGNIDTLNSKIENITTKGSWTTITVDSNNTYTIPYDGALYITCGTSDNNDGYLTYSISTWRTIRLNVFGQLGAYQYIPVAQGDVIAFVNKSSNITDILLQYRRM